MHAGGHLSAVPVDQNSAEVRLLMLSHLRESLFRHVHILRRTERIVSLV